MRNESKEEPSSSKQSPRKKKANLPDENRLRDSASERPMEVAFPEIRSSSLERSLPCTRLTEAERAQLVGWTRTPTSPHRLVVRSRIILLASGGLTTSEIALRLNVSPATVRLWCRRFTATGLPALERDRPGRGRPRGMTIVTVMSVLQAMRAHPADAPRWTTRGLSRASGASAASVWRIWQRYGLRSSSPRAEIERAIAQAISETANGSK